MDAGTVEGAIMMRDLATKVVERVDDALAKFEKRLGSTTDSSKKFASGYDKIGAALEKTSSRLESVGMALSLSISAPLIGAGLAASKFATDFERSMTQVVTLSGISEDSMQAMRKEVLALGPAVGKGPNELAKGLLVVTSTGIKGAAAIDVLTAAAKGSAVGLGEVNDVARAITSAVTAYGAENLSAARAADILFETVRLGGAEANELAGVLGRVVGIASQVGVSFEEVGAFIATYTRLGVDAAEATTGIRAVLTTLLQPTKEAEVALQTLGTSVGELRQAVAEKGLSAALIDLTDAAKGNEEALAAVFGNVRALAGVMGAAGSQSNALTSSLNTLKTGSGQLDAAFERNKKTVAATFGEFKAQLEATSIALGERLAPALTSALNAVKPLVESLGKAADLFAQLPQPVQTTALAFLAILAAAGPLAYTVGNLTGLVGKLVEAFGWFIKLESVAGGLTALKVGLTNVGTAAAGSTVFVAGLTAALYGLAAAGIIAIIWSAVDALNAMDQATQATAQAASAAEKNVKQITKILGYQVGSVQEAETALMAYSLGLRGASLEGLKGAKITTAVSDAFNKGAEAAGKAGVGVKTVVEGFGGLKAVASSTLPKVASLSDELAKFQRILNGLDEPTKANIRAGLKMGKSIEEVATKAKVAVEVVKLYEASLKDGGTAADEAAKKFQALQDRITGQDTIDKVLEMAGAIRETGLAVSQLNPDIAGEFADLIDKSIAIIVSKGDQVPPIFFAWAEQALAARLQIQGLAQVLDNIQKVGPVAAGVAGNPFADFSGVLDDVSISTETTDRIGDTLTSSVGGQLQTAITVATIEGFEAANPTVLERMFGGADQFGAHLAQVILSAIQGGGSVGKAIGASIGGQIGQAFGKDIGKKLGTALGGKIGAGIGKAVGAAIPVIGSLIGAGLGAVIGKGLDKLLKSEQKEVNKVREAFVQAHGGLAKLNEMAHDAGLTLDKLLKARNAKEYEAAVLEIEKAFAAVNERVQKLATDFRQAAAEGRIIGRDLWAAMLKDKDKEAAKAALKEVFEHSTQLAAEGFNKIATNFVALITGFQTGSKDLEAILEAISEKGKDGLSADFIADLKENLPTIAVLAEAAFGALLAKGLSVVEALNVMGPGLATIRDVLAAAGVNAEGFLGQILGWEGLVTKNKELFEVLSGVDDMLVGLSNSGLITQQSFDALTGILVKSFGTLTAGGASAEDALRLMQPQLQKAWEASQMWNLELDEGTKLLLEQAEQAGLVGEKFKPAAERMVDGINTLIGRLDILIKHLGGSIPDAAADGAAAVEESFSRIEIPEINVPIRYRYPDGLPDGGNIELPEMADGGIVRQATPVIAGEAGPEAIVPLDRLESWLERAAIGTGGGDLYVTLELNAPVGATEEWLERQVPAAVMRAIEDVGGEPRARFDRMARRSK